MIKNKIIIWLFTLICAFWECGALADVVNLKNGDKLTGEILRMENSILQFTTGYTEEIRVKWDDVSCISTDKDCTFVLYDSQILIGRSICIKDGKIKIEGPKILETMELSIVDIKAINPSPSPPSVTYKANLGAGGSVTDGNTNTKAANASGKFEARSKQQRFTLRSKLNYGKTDGEITTRNANGSIKYDFFVTGKFYSYAHSLFERDDFQDINLRSIVGLGIGYQFFDTERMSLLAEAGVSYFNEDYDIAEDNHYTSARWSVGFDLDVVLDKIKFYHLHEGYYSLEESNSYYITAEQGFRMHIANNFFTNFQVDYSYNSQPAEGREKSDTTYIIGLTYEYNF